MFLTAGLMLKFEFKKTVRCARVAGFVLTSNEEDLIIAHVFSQIFHQCYVCKTK